MRSVREDREEWKSPAYQPAAFDSARDSINGVSIHGFRSFTLWLAEPMLKVDLRNNCENSTVSVSVSLVFVQSRLSALQDIDCVNC